MKNISYTSILFTDDEDLNNALNKLRQQVFEDMLRLLPVVARKVVGDVLDLEVGVRAFVKDNNIDRGDLEPFLRNVNKLSSENPSVAIPMILQEAWSLTHWQRQTNGTREKAETAEEGGG